LDEERKTRVGKMRSIPILIIALMIAVLVPHVCAESVTAYYIDPSKFNVTYPQEYYDMTAKADAIIGRALDNHGNWMMLSYNDIYGAAPYRLVAIQIALEKQNELIVEQNELLGKLLNQTYTGRPMDSSGNLVAGGGYYTQIQPNH
jgi:hypothetical protein